MLNLQIFSTSHVVYMFLTVLNYVFGVRVTKNNVRLDISGH